MQVSCWIFSDKNGSSFPLFSNWHLQSWCQIHPKIMHRDLSSKTLSLYNIAFVHRAANSERLRIPSLLAASTHCILLQMHISLPRPSAQNFHCHSPPPPPSFHFLERRHWIGEFKGTIVGEHKCDYLQECRMYSQGWKGHNVKACIQSDVKPLPPSHSPFTHTLQSLHVQQLGSKPPGNIQA